MNSKSTAENIKIQKKKIIKQKLSQQVIWIPNQQLKTLKLKKKKNKTKTFSTSYSDIESRGEFQIQYIVTTTISTRR